MKGRRVPGRADVWEAPLSPKQLKVVDDDGQFFIEHPDMWERIRPYRAGEICDPATGREVPPADGLVRVVRISRELNKFGPVRLRIGGGQPLDKDIAAMISEMRRKYEKE